MLSQLLMIFVMISFDSCFLEGTVHVLDLVIGIADFQYRNPDLGDVMSDIAIDGRQWTG